MNNNSALKVGDVMDTGNFFGEMQQAYDKAVVSGWNPDDQIAEGKDSYEGFLKDGQSLIINLYIAWRMFADPANSGKFEITWKDYVESMGLTDRVAQGLIWKWRDPEGYKREKAKRKKKSGGSNITERIQKIYDETIIEPTMVEDGIITVEISSGGVIVEKQIDISDFIS